MATDNPIVGSVYVPALGEFQTLQSPKDFYFTVRSSAQVLSFVVSFCCAAV